MLVRRFCKTLLPGRGVRIVAAALLTAAMAAGLYAAHAAPAAMATKKDEVFQTSIPAAVVLDPDSNSLLFDKNGDQLVAPASLAKLMTLEYVFNEIKQGRLKLDDTFKISENAWRKGGAPSHGSTMFAAIHSDVKSRRSHPRHYRGLCQRRLHVAALRKGWPATRPRSARC